MRIQYLYFLPVGKEYRLFVYDKDHCDLCKSQLKNLVCHYFNSDQRFGEKVFCADCIREAVLKYSSLGQPEWRWANHVSIFPRTAIPILSPVEITNSKSIQEAMRERHDAMQIIDHTRWGGRDLQLDGSEMIGKSLEQLEAEESWKEDAVSILEFHANARPSLFDNRNNQRRLE